MLFFWNSTGFLTDASKQIFFSEDNWFLLQTKRKTILISSFLKETVFDLYELVLTEIASWSIVRMQLPLRLSRIFFCIGFQNIKKAAVC